MNTATIKLTSHAAKGDVPKYLIGIQFWISGEPADVMVNVTEPKAMAAGIKRRGKLASLNRLTAMGYTEKATTKTLTPPYVSRAHAITTASTARL